MYREIEVQGDRCTGRQNCRKIEVQGDRSIRRQKYRKTEQQAAENSVVKK
ncbi:MAG: hypothetical protein HFG87_09360 [Dorea sp.]|nr:hypothetical protein [Dorea sp.]